MIPKIDRLQYVQANLPLHRPVQMVQTSLKLCSTSKQDIPLSRPAQVVQTNLKWLTNTDSHQPIKLLKFNHDRSLRNSYTPFYTQRTFLELTEIYEYLHGNVKMSTQSVRAPWDSQITRHTDQASRILQDQHPQQQKSILYPRVRIEKKRECAQTKLRGVQIKSKQQGAEFQSNLQRPDSTSNKKSAHPAATRSTQP